MVRVLVSAIVLTLPAIVFGQPRVATPTFSVGGGEYATVIIVVVRVSTPGATIRFTQNGSDPTEFDPVIVSGSRIAINTSQTLKARAWKTGSRPSAVRAETYTMVSVAAGPPIGTGDAAAGGAQSVLATPDGQVFTWDRDQIPMRIDDLSGVTAVAAGPSHALAVGQDGEVYAWGANGSGQLGDGTHAKRRRPIRVAGVTNVVRAVAGRSHSLALTEDGRVFAWGANARGQLGTGSPKPSGVPTEITSLSNIVAVDAGHSHSIAVTRTGEVYVWGANEHGQLGDGSQEDRRSPVRIALERVTAVAAGGDHTLALDRDGAVFSWGFGARGQLGTGSITIALVPTRIDGLLAFAIAAGRNFSAAIGRDRALVMWGANDFGQLGDGTRIDQTTPVVGPPLTGLSTLALGTRHAIAVTAAGDVWTWGRASAPSTALTGVEDWGPPVGALEEPEPPTMQPPPGAYPAPQTVTLTAAEADYTLRFTLDGADPTMESALYVEPFVVSATTTVRARAFSAVEGVPASAIVTNVYTIDMSPPTIVAEVSPPLTSGWMTTPVTVTFTCDDNSGTVTCPSPVVVSSDGADQLIRGTAIDPAGNQATASATVSVDLRPPSVALLNAPDGNTTTDAQILLSGRVTDAGSGLADALRCNGEAVAVLQETFQCLVNLRPGVNSITLQARDVAGHVAAAGLTITRVGTATTLTIAPDSRTMAINEVAAMSLRDEFGASVANATWSSSDATIVSLSNDDPPFLTAIGEGHATITAHKEGIAVEAAITVVAALALSPGTTRWTIAPTPGYSMRSPIFTHRVDTTVPDMFVVETQTWGEATLRAVNSEGEVLWKQESPGIPFMGDSFGGVLAGVLYDVNQGDDFRAYVRLGNAGGVPPWRYDSAGSLVRPAQATDGTIYAVEYVPDGLDANGEEIWDKHVVVLDGRNGRLRRRVPLASEVFNFTSEFEGRVLSVKPLIVCASTRNETTPETIGPVVGSDGRGYLLVRRHVKHSFATCREPIRPRRTIEVGVDLVIFAPDHEPIVQPIYSNLCDVPEFHQSLCDVPPVLDQLVPDGIGGVLAVWVSTRNIVNGRFTQQWLVTRRNEEGSLFETPLSGDTKIDMIGQGGLAYVGSSTSYQAIDVTSWTPKWTASFGRFSVVAPRPDGGIAVFDAFTGDYRTVNSAGQFETTALQLPRFWPTQEFGNWIGVNGAGLLSVSGQFPDATRWIARDGDRQGRLSLRTPGVGIFVKSHQVQAPLNFQHLSIRVTPTFQSFWRDLKPNDFVQRDEYDNIFMTIGAGTAEGDTSATCSGTLTKGINRNRDVGADPIRLEKLPLHAFDEIRLINDLYVYFAGYKDDLEYACVPEMNPGKYNSNSFVSGILRRAGAPLPLFPLRGNTAPGWATPVPSHKFDP